MQCSRRRKILFTALIYPVQLPLEIKKMNIVKMIGLIEQHRNPFILPDKEEKSLLPD